MSQIQGHVGKWELTWKSVPHGKEGVAQVEAKHPDEAPQGVLLEVRWRRDPQGLWLTLPDGSYGFDFDAQVSDEGRTTFRVLQRNSDHEWMDLQFARPGEDVAQGAGGARKSLRVRAQMPGKIVRILVKADQTLEKDQSIAVMEAMKMENEIRAPQAGKVSKIAVTEGQAVETGADLFVIDPV